MPGFIEHAYDKGTLDDLSNQAENFVVVDVGEDAARALATHGGLAWYDQRNVELWKLAQDIPRTGQRYFERLLFERDPEVRAALAPRYHATLARMDRLLDDPFYQQFVIYVHPRGIRPIGYHIARLLDRNPRTPFRSTRRCTICIPRSTGVGARRSCATARLPAGQAA